MVLKRDAAFVYLVYVALSSFGMSITFFSNMIYQVTVVGLDAFQLVLVGTVLELTIFLFEVPTGILADRKSRRLSVIIGTALIGAGFMIEGLFPLFGAVLLAQVVWGLGATFSSGADSAWITDEVGEAKAGQLFLRASQVGSVAGLAGVIVSLLLGIVRINIPVVFGGVVMVLLAGYLLLVMPENGFKPAPREQAERFGGALMQFRAGLRTIRTRPLVLAIVGITFFWGAASESYDRLNTAHLINNVGMPIAQVPEIVWFALISAVGTLLSYTVLAVVRRRVNTTKGEAVARLLLRINALLIGVMIVFALAGDFWLAAAALLAVGALRGLSEPLRMTWLNQGLDSSVRATVISMTNQTDALGQIAGGPAVGWVGRQFGVRTALIVGAMLLAPSLPLIARHARPVPDAAIAESQAPETV